MECISYKGDCGIYVCQGIKKEALALTVDKCFYCIVNVVLVLLKTLEAVYIMA